MNALVLLAGLHSLFFAAFHCLFWKALDWKRQLARLSPNNAVMQLLNLRLTFLFFAHAAVCFWYGDALIPSRYDENRSAPPPAPGPGRYL